MGRHAAPSTEASAPPAFVAPAGPVVMPAPGPFAAPQLGLAPVAYTPAASPVRDDFTAINLLVPQQQTLPVRALVWGIVAVIFYIVVAPSVFALVYGVLGVRRARRLEDAGLGAQGRGMSIAGIVLGAVGLAMLLLAIVGAILAVVFTATPPVRSYPS
jgi:hypothetical protein